MHSDESQREIRSLYFHLGILPGTPSCDTYPTMGMSLREIHETYDRRTGQPPVRRGHVIGRLIYDLKTREMRVEDVGEKHVGSL